MKACVCYKRRRYREDFFFSMLFLLKRIQTKLICPVAAELKPCKLQELHGSKKLLCMSTVVLRNPAKGTLGSIKAT